LTTNSVVLVPHLLTKTDHKRCDFSAAVFSLFSVFLIWGHSRTQHRFTSS